MTTPLLFDPLTRRRMRYRTNRLAKAFRLSPEDREDLEQDLIVEILNAMRCHDPAQSSAQTFARRVMDKWYCHTARRIRAERRRSPVFVPLSDAVCRSSDFEDHHSRIAAVDLRLDLEPMLQALPRKFGLLSEQLKILSVEESASEHGVHRGTVYRWVGELRTRLAGAEDLLA